MRVVICAFDYPPLVGGIARYSASLSAALAAQADVTVVAPRLAGSEPFDRAQPFQTIRLPNTPLLRELSLRRTLLRLHGEAAIDWVISTVWFPAALVVHAVLRRIRVRHAVSAHGSEIFDDRLSWRRTIKSLLRPWKHRALNAASVVLPVSRYTRDRLVRDGLTAPMMLLPNGVDPARFHPAPRSAPLLRQLSLPPDAYVLLSLGRLDLHKGHDVVLDAMARVRGKIPKLSYVIAGDGPERARLAQRAQALGLADAVRFAGIVPETAVADYYNACDLFVLLSREMPGRLDLIEGFGAAFLEAAACGKPVLAGRSGGVGDAVADHETGLLVDPLDANAAAEAIVRLHDDRAWAEQLGRNGRRRCEERFTWARVAGQLLERLGGLSP